jgi:hypothetical protein
MQSVRPAPARRAAWDLISQSRQRSRGRITGWRSWMGFMSGPATVVGIVKLLSGPSAVSA